MKNNKLLTVPLSVLLVSLMGCGAKNNKAEYQNSTVECNDEQLVMVEKQYKICTETEYLDTYCYDQARVEQCDIIKKDAKAN